MSDNRIKKLPNLNKNKEQQLPSDAKIARLEKLAHFEKLKQKAGRHNL